ncbi:MAG: hypothetical protein KDK70_09565 [Myxococcales bacterium]|nr:hypothetical protein [Myxococcales bacterium]
MLLPTALSLTMLTALSFEDIPKPAVAEVDVTHTEKRDHPWDLVEAPDGSFYVLSNQPTFWPRLMIRRYDAQGVEQWSHEHEIYRTPAGAGFDYITTTSADADGNLYFAYHTNLNGHGSFLVKMSPAHEVAWEVQLAKCSSIRQVRPTRKYGTHDVAVVCGTNGGGTQVTRLSGADGAQLSRNRSDSGNETERYLQAAQTKTDETYVVGAWDGMKSDDLRRGTLAYKFAADGSIAWRRLWERTSSKPNDGAYYRSIAAYPDREGGVLGVFAVINTDTIEIHKIDPAGNRVGVHVLETGGHQLSDSSLVTAEHNWINDEITVAWDDKQQKLPATVIGVAVVDFEPRPQASTAKGAPSAAASSVKPAAWKGLTKRLTRIDSDDHDALVDVDVGDDGAIHLAAVDLDGGHDHIRITRLSRFANGGYASLRFRRREGHARPTHLLRSGSRLHVVGIEDAAVGDFIHYQADLLRLVLWTDGSQVITAGPKASRPAIKPTAKPAAKPTAKPAGAPAAAAKTSRAPAPRAAASR